MYQVSISQENAEHQQDLHDCFMTKLIEQFVEEIEEHDHDQLLLEHFHASNQSETRDQIITDLAIDLANKKIKEISS